MIKKFLILAVLLLCCVPAFAQNQQISYYDSSGILTRVQMATMGGNGTQIWGTQIGLVYHQVSYSATSTVTGITVTVGASTDNGATFTTVGTSSSTTATITFSGTYNAIRFVITNFVGAGSLDGNYYPATTAYPSGSGTAGQCAYWVSTTVLGGDSGCLYNSTTHALTLTGPLQATTITATTAFQAPNGTGGGVVGYGFTNSTNTGQTYDGSYWRHWFQGTQQYTVRDGEFNLLSAVALKWNQDTVLVRDTANTLALKNGSAAQDFHVYGTAALYAFLQHNGTIGRIGTAGGSSALNVYTGSDIWQWTTGGNYLPLSDNAYTIGDSTHRVGAVYVVNIDPGNSAMTIGGNFDQRINFKTNASTRVVIGNATESYSLYGSDNQSDLGLADNRWRTVYTPIISGGTSSSDIQLQILGATRMTQSATTHTITTEVVLSGLPTGTAALRDALCTDTNNRVQRNTNAGGCLVSDPAYKTDIEDIDMGLETVLKLRPVTYRWKPEMEKGDDVWMGFLADQAMSVDKRLGFTRPDGSPLGFNYLTYPAVLTKAVQELEARIRALEAK